MSFIEPLFHLLAGHLDRIRRNHGLEHATIHLLSQRFPGVFLAGHSDTQGFWLFGQVPLEAVAQAAQEALERLRRERLPLVVLAATVALIFSQPVGMWLQERLTTSGDPGGLEIVEVIPSQRGQLPTYRVLTRG